MYRASYRPLCEILLASFLVSVGCKSAPPPPEFSETSDSKADLAQLEADRAEILEAQKQLEADMKLAEEGWPEGKPAPKVEASYTTKGGKYDDEEIIEIKTNVKQSTEKNDRAGCLKWLSKLKPKCKDRQKELNKVLVEVEVKIENAKKNEKYGDVWPKRPVVIPPADESGKDTKYIPPADTTPKELPKDSGVQLPTQKVDLPSQKK